MIAAVAAFRAAIATGELADRVEVGRTESDPPHVLIFPGMTEDEQTRMSSGYATENHLYTVRCSGTDLHEAMWQAEAVDKRLRPGPMREGLVLKIPDRSCSAIQRGATETFPDYDLSPAVWVVVTLYEFTSEPS